MTNPSLGRLIRHDPRTFWKNESAHFTPWLAMEENIALLGEAIGVELEVEGVEVAVGAFYADILCKDLNRKTRVLIENQLERTDHDHLGKLFTYAAGLDAATVIWIAREFRPEHRAALDWLNDISTEDFNFFGLTVELMQIGNSPMAPWFEVVVKPNEWAKTVKEAASPGAKPMTEGQKFWVEYWEAFGEFLESQGRPFNPPKPYPSHWMAWGIGGKGSSLNAGGSQRDGHASVWVTFSDSNAKAYFNILDRDRAVINAALGFEPDWQEKPDYKESLILRRQDWDLKDRARWPKLFAWKLETMTLFNRVFRPRISTLDASDWDPEDPSA